MYAENLKHGRAANRRHHVRPWIYGSRVGTFSLVFLVSYSMRAADGSKVSPDYRGSLSGRNHMHACLVPTISQENATLILTQVSRDRHPGQQKLQRLCAQHLTTSYTSKGQRIGGAVRKDINRSILSFFPRGNRVCRNRN